MMPSSCTAMWSSSLDKADWASCRRNKWIVCWDLLSFDWFEHFLHFPVFFDANLKQTSHILCIVFCAFLTASARHAGNCCSRQQLPKEIARWGPSWTVPVDQSFCLLQVSQLLLHPLWHYRWSEDCCHCHRPSSELFFFWYMDRKRSL